jgi:DNA polymerase III subunit epsilon
LPPPRRPQVGERRPREALPPRPEFYDFDLLGRARGRAAPQLERPLGELSYVVFDTETTGLQPAAGDQIVQIAAVRIVNRRLLSGEIFDALVDPRRPIPKASIRFHGITDAMVQGRPPIEIVLPHFHKYVGDSVLVAHNADFDLAFLCRDEERLGVRFDHPLLDTHLISAALHDHLPEHSLDAIAARFGIALVDRHNALGDAMGTAQLFLRMLDLLEAQGIRKLREALALTRRVAERRYHQAALFGERSKASA